MAGRNSAVEEFQKLEVTNLDKKVPKNYKITFGEITDEELKSEFTGRFNEYCFGMTHEIAFKYFKTIAEKPDTAVALAKELAKMQAYKKNDVFDSRNRELYTEAEKGNKEFVEEAKRDLFIHRFKEGIDPHINIPFFSADSSDLYAIVKDNPTKALRFFEKCYNELIKQAKTCEFKYEYKMRIEEIKKAIKTGDFSNRTIESVGMVQKKDIY